MARKNIHHGGIFNYFEGANIRNLVINGNMTNNGSSEKDRQEEKQGDYTDKEIATALANIVGKGKAIDAKWKFAGALWLLHFLCNFPSKANEFCERVNQLPLPDDMEFTCEYNNIRPYTTLSFIQEDARYMDNVRYSNNDRGVFLQLRHVARSLQEELARVHDKQKIDLDI